MSALFFVILSLIENKVVFLYAFAVFREHKASIYEQE